MSDICIAFLAAVQPRCGAVQHTAIGVAAQHRWRTGQGRVVGVAAAAVVAVAAAAYVLY